MAGSHLPEVRVLIALAALFTAACSERPTKVQTDLSVTSAGQAEEDAAFQKLSTFEDGHRSSVDFRHEPTTSDALGPDPYAIAALPEEKLFAAILRGEDALVLLDEDLRELHRVETPSSPTALLVRPGGQIMVGAELAPDISHYRLDAKRQLVRTGSVSTSGAFPRSLASHASGPVFIADERSGEVSALVLTPTLSLDRRVSVGACRGPIEMRATARHLVVNCLLDHALLVYQTDSKGLPLEAQEPARIVHDGPFWAAAARDTARGLTLVAGGVENRPLERKEGSFGYIDSFVFTYQVEAGVARLHSQTNVSAHGVITPRWLDFTASAQALNITAAGYGGDRIAKIKVSLIGAAEPSVETGPMPPGMVSMVRDPKGGWVGANTLLDAFVRWGVDGQTSVTKVSGDGTRPVKTRVGEALFFTRLMAPWNTSEGRWSRFTCETCHFEGYVDGRNHFTGRGKVFSSTKPLLGLGTNRPYFTRALDKTMARMVWNEFKVANKGSGKDPWFSLESRDFPWLQHIDGVPERMEASWLRESLMRFLMAFAHRRNPATVGRAAFSEEERRGAEIFAQSCVRCPDSRLLADDPQTKVPFAQWESLIFSGRAPIVWASARHFKTGVTPYVHRDGARPPSLRRLYKKRPYFTNARAQELEGLLQMAGTAESGDFFHADPPAESARFSGEEVGALRAFLELL